MKNIILIFAILFAVKVYAQPTCKGANLSGISDTTTLSAMFDVALQAQDYDCGLNVYSRIKNIRTVKRDKVRAAFCNYRLKKYADAVTLFEASIDTLRPKQNECFFYAEAILNNTADTAKAMNMLFKEVNFFNASILARSRIENLILNKCRVKDEIHTDRLTIKDWQTLIYLEKIPDKTSKPKDVKIAVYFKNLYVLTNNPAYKDSALYRYTAACNNNNPEGCYGVYSLIPENENNQKINILKRTILAYNATLQNLGNLFEPSNSDVFSANENISRTTYNAHPTTFYQELLKLPVNKIAIDSSEVAHKQIKNYYKGSLAAIHLTLAKEYSLLQDKNIPGIINNIDLSIQISDSTTEEAKIFDQAVSLLKKVGLTDRVLYYESIYKTTDTYLGITVSASSTMNEIKNKVLYLDYVADGIHNISFAKIPDSTIKHVLAVYNDLGYAMEYEELMPLYEYTYPKWENDPTYNLLCLNHAFSFKRSLYNKYRGNLTQWESSLKTMSTDTLLSIYYKDYILAKDADEWERCVKITNALEDLITKRGDTVSDVQWAGIYFNRGVAYCNIPGQSGNATKCFITAKSFTNDPDMLKQIAEAEKKCK